MRAENLLRHPGYLRAKTWKYMVPKQRPDWQASRAGFGTLPESNYLIAATALTPVNYNDNILS